MLRALLPSTALLGPTPMGSWPAPQFPSIFILPCREDPVRVFTGQVAPAQVLEVLCRERARFQLALEPPQPQVRALLALQWGLLGTRPEK